MTALTDEQFDALYDLANDNDFTVRSYSGRGMMGKECLGITTNGSVFSIGLALGSSEVLEYIFASTGVREDSMGRGTVVYFPSLAAPIRKSKDDED
jgi:hypothetical protein